MQLFVEKEGRTEAEKEILRSFFIEQMGKLLRKHSASYNYRRIKDWAELSAVSDEFLAYLAKRKSNQKQPPLPELSNLALRIANAVLDSSLTEKGESPDTDLQGRTDQLPVLPAKPYRELIGRDANIGQIMAALRDPAGKWVMAVDGIGGIGKTALAREVADRCRREDLFTTIVWESAAANEFAHENKGIRNLTFETTLDAISRQLRAFNALKLKGEEKEAAVKVLLRSRRVLVVLDNLETAGESQNEIALHLSSLLNPSKAILTSRHRFQGDLYFVHLAGLDEIGSILFMQQEAEEKGLKRSSQARARDLQQIAKETGGSPLAMKLVIGQLEFLPLEQVLKQLKQIHISDNEDAASKEDEYVRFYKGIFFPSWKLLSEHGKALLTSMAPFEPNLGGTYDAVKVTSGMADDILLSGLSELWKLSFVEVGGSSGLNPRYYLHPLTKHFIMSDIIRVTSAGRFRHRGP
jgi:hypothetical protein